MTTCPSLYRISSCSSEDDARATSRPSSSRHRLPRPFTAPAYACRTESFSSFPSARPEEQERERELWPPRDQPSCLASPLSSSSSSPRLTAHFPSHHRSPSRSSAHDDADARTPTSTSTTTRAARSPSSSPSSSPRLSLLDDSETSSSSNPPPQRPAMLFSLSCPSNRPSTTSSFAPLPTRTPSSSSDRLETLQAAATQASEEAKALERTLDQLRRASLPRRAGPGAVSAMQSAVMSAAASAAGQTEKEKGKGKEKEKAGRADGMEDDDDDRGGKGEAPGTMEESEDAEMALRDDADAEKEKERPHTPPPPPFGYRPIRIPAPSLTQRPHTRAGGHLGPAFLAALRGRYNQLRFDAASASASWSVGVGVPPIGISPDRRFLRAASTRPGTSRGDDRDGPTILSTTAAATDPYSTTFGEDARRIARGFGRFYEYERAWAGGLLAGGGGGGGARRGKRSESGARTGDGSDGEADAEATDRVAKRAKRLPGGADDVIITELSHPPSPSSERGHGAAAMDEDEDEGEEEHPFRFSVHQTRLSPPSTPPPVVVVRDGDVPSGADSARERERELEVELERNSSKRKMSIAALTLDAPVSRAPMVDPSNSISTSASTLSSSNLAAPRPPSLVVASSSSPSVVVPTSTLVSSALNALATPGSGSSAAAAATASFASPALRVQRQPQLTLRKLVESFDDVMALRMESCDRLEGLAAASSSSSSAGRAAGEVAEAEGSASDVDDQLEMQTRRWIDGEQRRQPEHVGEERRNVGAGVASPAVSV